MVGGTLIQFCGVFNFKHGQYNAKAYSFFLQAIRKAPQHSAIGFKQTAHKFVVVVQLLLGEIPDRATFRDPILKKSLFPYLQLTQGV